MRMRLSRRHFLATTAGAAWAFGFWEASPGTAQVLTAQDAEAGGPALEADEIEVLSIAAQSAIGVTPLIGPYAGYFSHHARHHVRKRKAYRDFLDAVRGSSRADLKTFLAWQGPAQANLVGEIRARAGKASDIERFVFQDSLALFRMTDAWLHLGYESWPGTARGLESYRLAPSRG